MKTLSDYHTTQAILPNPMYAAWSDYRNKQENIVDYLLQMCDNDGDLCDFVKGQAWDTIQTRLTSGADPAKEAFIGTALPTGAAAMNWNQNNYGNSPDWNQDNYESSPLTAQWVSSDCTPPLCGFPRPSEKWTSDVISSSTSSPGRAEVALPLELKSPEAKEDYAMNLLARLLKEDNEELDTEWDTKEQQQISVLNRVMNSGDKPRPLESTRQVSEQADKDSEVKTTMVLWLQGMRNLTPSEALTHLKTKFDVVGGRDIDFFYCPTDFGKPYVKGYAIVNFRDAEQAKKMIALSGPDKEWSLAKMQGLAKNSSRFLKRHGHVRSSRFRPLIWPSPDDSTPTCLGDAPTTEKEQ